METLPTEAKFDINLFKRPLSPSIVAFFLCWIKSYHRDIEPQSAPLFRLPREIIDYILFFIYRPPFPFYLQEFSNWPGINRLSCTYQRHSAFYMTRYIKLHPWVDEMDFLKKKVFFYLIDERERSFKFHYLYHNDCDPRICEYAYQEKKRKVA